MRLLPFRLRKPQRTKNWQNFFRKSFLSSKVFQIFGKSHCAEKKNERGPLCSQNVVSAEHKKGTLRLKKFMKDVALNGKS